MNIQSEMRYYNLYTKRRTTELIPTFYEIEDLRFSMYWRFCASCFDRAPRTRGLAQCHRKYWQQSVSSWWCLSSPSVTENWRRIHNAITIGCGQVSKYLFSWNAWDNSFYLCWGVPGEAACPSVRSLAQRFRRAFSPSRMVRRKTWLI